MLTCILIISNFDCRNMIFIATLFLFLGIIKMLKQTNKLK